VRQRGTYEPFLRIGLSDRWTEEGIGLGRAEGFEPPRVANNKRLTNAQTGDGPQQSEFYNAGLEGHQCWRD